MTGFNSAQKPLAKKALCPMRRWPPEREVCVRITDGSEVCRVCGKVPSVIYCDGCDKPLCRSCRRFDMWQQGCGSIPTKVFCVECATDPWVNPWGSAMD